MFADTMSQAARSDIWRMCANHDFAEAKSWYTVWRHYTAPHGIGSGAGMSAGHDKMLKMAAFRRLERLPEKGNENICGNDMNS